MAKSLLIIAALLGVFQLAHSAYVLDKTYSGTSFFDGWDFFTAGDPTHGYVDYVDRNAAQSHGLINATSSQVYIGTDYKNQASGRGRQSVRLTSKTVFNSGLFIIDLSHMPTGCGTWPAWWTVGPNWPNQGEIDVIEGVNTQSADQTTLHTNGGCTMNGESNTKYSGHMVNANCEGNQGCGITTGEGSYGAPFNSHQGGVFAMEWTNQEIQTFYWPRSGIPSDITSDKPNPGAWGKPYAFFQLGSNCPANHFRDHQMVIDLTFCGDWAGAVFGSQCGGKGNCNDYVRTNPGAFKEAYWLIHYIKVFQNK